MKSEEKPQYTCPMHPEIIRDEPGDCPKCGMHLEPMTVQAEEKNDTTHRVCSCQTCCALGQAHRIVDEMGNEEHVTLEHLHSLQMQSLVILSLL